jgi:hypothetical protein
VIKNWITECNLQSAGLVIDMIDKHCDSLNGSANTGDMTECLATVLNLQNPPSITCAGRVSKWFLMNKYNNPSFCCTYSLLHAQQDALTHNKNDSYFKNDPHTLPMQKIWSSSAGFVLWSPKKWLTGLKSGGLSGKFCRLVRPTQQFGKLSCKYSHSNEIWTVKCIWSVNRLGN